MADNLIHSLQLKYDALASWANKPSELWFSSVWPRRQNGTLVNYPLITFTHTGTPQQSTFAHAALENWQWRFTAYEASPQAVQAIYRGVMYGGGIPESKLGFWYPASVTMPSGYRFLHLKPIGPFRIEPLDGQFGPTGASIVRLVWDMELMVQQVA